MTTVPGVVPQDAKRSMRKHGDGNLTQLTDGRWRGRIMLGRKPDGKPDRPWVYGSTQREVLKKMAELSRKADQGERADASKERQTLAQYLGTWLAAVRIGTRPRTHQRYAQIVRLHIVPTLGRTKLSALRPDAVQTLYSTKLAEGLAPRTVEKIHVVLHRALRMAVKWGNLSKNPADTDAVDKPRAPKHDIRPPDGAELLMLIDTAAEDRLAALWTVAIHTGLRQGELLGLCWQDVDLDRATLTVRQTLQGVKGTVPQWGEPKSWASRRTISLAAVAVHALRHHKARQAEERLKTTDWADNDLVFCSHVGTPLMWRKRHPRLQEGAQTGRIASDGTLPRLAPRSCGPAPTQWNAAQGRLAAPGTLDHCRHRRHLPARHA
jgi:integrase